MSGRTAEDQIGDATQACIVVVLPETREEDGRALAGIYALRRDFVIDIGGRDAGYEFTLFVWFIRQKTDTASKWIRFCEEGLIGVASRKRS